MLGVLQGVTELFPISSLGHTVLFPTLFGWNELVKAQSRPESFWLAFVVMLHVGSALGLLGYFRREWVEIIRAFFRTLRKRADREPDRAPGVADRRREYPGGHHRPCARAPAAHADRQAGSGGGLPDGQRPAAVRGGALPPPRGGARTGVREGAKPDGGRELDTLEYREAFVIGAAQSTALVAGISRDGVTMGAGLARGLDHSDAARFAFLLATPIILAAGLFKLPDLTGHLGDGVRGQALVAAWRRR